MHSDEARLLTSRRFIINVFPPKPLGGPGYDVTHSRFLAGCTRRLPGILAYHYHAHQPAALD